MILVILITVGVLAYIGCGVLGYGLTLGYFQRHFFNVRRRAVRGTAISVAMAGPAGILIALVSGEWGHHGLLWKAEDSDWIKDESLNRSDMRLTAAHTRYPDREPASAARSDRPGS